MPTAASPTPNWPGRSASPGHESARRARERSEAVPVRPVVVIDLAANRTARGEGALAEIDSCYFLAGAESFLLKVRVPTIAQLEHLIVRLNRVPGIASTSRP